MVIIFGNRILSLNIIIHRIRSELERTNTEIDIIQFKPIDIKKPIIVVGLPDVGLVGTIAVSYLIDKLKMNELGYIDSRRFPPFVIIKESAVKNPVRIYGKDNIIAVISDLPFLPFIINRFSKSLLAWARTLSPKTVIGITGLPVYDRIQINKPAVAGIATTDSTRNILDEAGVRLLSDGIFSGIYAGLIKECNTQNIPNITLLAESYLNFPDPAASLETLSVVGKILNIHIDLKQLKEEAERIKINMRELMLHTEKALKQSQKMQTGNMQTMYG